LCFARKKIFGNKDAVRLGTPFETSPTRQRPLLKIEMDNCIEAILQSVAGCKSKTAKMKDNDRALLYRRINSSVLGFLSDSGEQNRQNSAVQKTEAVVANVTHNLNQLVCDYLWLTRCCNNATEIADTFNSMHLAGVVVCKSFFILCKYHSNRNTADINTMCMPSLFPQYATIHVSPKKIMSLSYSELVYVLTSLQEQWHILVRMDLRAAVTAIVACMVRFCVLYCLQLPALELDDTQEREKVLSGDRTVLYVMSKRATRHFVTTFVCMLRELVIFHHSNTIHVAPMDSNTKTKHIVHEVLRYGQTLPRNVSVHIKSCFTKIKCIRTTASTAPDATQPSPTSHNHPVSARKEAPVSTQDTLLPQLPSDETLWAFLVKKIGAQKLGPCPRKISPAYSVLVTDVIISLSANNDNKTNLQVRGAPRARCFAGSAPRALFCGERPARAFLRGAPCARCFAGSALRALCLRRHVYGAPRSQGPCAWGRSPLSTHLAM